MISRARHIRSILFLLTLVSGVAGSPMLMAQQPPQQGGPRGGGRGGPPAGGVGRGGGGFGGFGGRGAAVDNEPRGIRVNTDRALQGYTLFAPLTSDTTHLIDMEGQVVRTWRSDVAPGAWTYIRENGNVVRGGWETETSGFSGGGQGGRIEEFTFDGELIWSYSINDETQLSHHDAALLPNGNILAIVWTLKTPEEARRLGRMEGFISNRGLWMDKIVELEPVPPDDARIVWQWNTWDHVIQNVDPDADNYGDPADHPERIDINADDAASAPTPPGNPGTDLFHTNSVAYNASLDQIVVSVPHFNEVWVIDHGTTTEEAASSSGGRMGKGGDLLYRWGDPANYGRGRAEDQRLGFEHDARWIPEGRPGGHHITIFSNRTPGENGTFTQLYEIAPPIDEEGRYSIPDDGPFGPAEPVWTYSDPQSFNATYISGAERLENGNTLVSSGPQGRLFEITSDGEIVWEYWSPFQGGLRNGAGGMNPYSIFRAIRIPADHPALQGRDLEPLEPQPDLVSPETP